MPDKTIGQRTRKIASIVAIGTALVACQNSQFGEKTQIGAAAGAAGGGLLAAASGGGASGIAAGVLLGGLLGGAVGYYLDDQDKQYLAQTTQQGLERSKSGQTTSWHNPDTGHHGTITPQNSYQRSNGQYCRDFRQTVTVDGRVESATGTACRQADGTWEIV